EYNCQDCKQIFEDWQKNYEERDIPCPVCGGQASRLISSTSFVLKGGGWYASGYSEKPAPPETASAASGGNGTTPKAACDCPGKAKAAEAKPAEAKPVETKQAAPPAAAS
ncbi:MAG: zinc ribbon domain-containing protein, partial [Humidesulfovibrio sp.]|nr:zinc ribbon domain-containing protein [Humidesulfovibrio sp.]